MTRKPVFRSAVGDGDKPGASRWGVLLLLISLAACQSSDGARWVDAPITSDLERRDTLQENMDRNDYDADDLACEHQLESARAALAQAGSPILRRLVQACAREQLGFGDELRCHENRQRLQPPAGAQ